jgi:hypothetical protein
VPRLQHRARLTRLLVVPLAAAAFAAAGCGSSDPPPEPSGISYVRTGGLANTAESLVIRADGRATLAVRRGEREAFTVPEATLDALRDDLDAADFEELPRNDRSIPEPDGFNYVMAYRGHLVVREQSGLEPALRPVIRRLQGIIDSRR